MCRKVSKFIKQEIEDYRILLRNVPSIVMTLFTVSVILMNLLANKEISTPFSWLVLDCGFLVSWLSFLAMDMLTKRFGATASIKLSILAVSINLLVCLILYLVSNVPGNWGAFYTYENPIINAGLDDTFGGTWYILLGSTVAFVLSSICNAVINVGIGKLCKHNTFIAYALRSYISTTVGQFVDNLVFAFMVSYVFFGWTVLQCIVCAITGCIIELVCEIIFSPIGYRVCKKWETEHIGCEYINYLNKGEQAK